MSVAPDRPVSGRRRGVPLHWQILIGLLLGLAAGVFANQAARGADGRLDASVEWFAENIARAVGQVFMNLMFMVVIPLVFCALTLGMVSIGDVRRLGRIGIKTLGFTVALSTISVLIGLTLVNVLRPGEALSPGDRAVLQERYKSGAASAVESAQKAKTFKDALLDIIPRNPLQEAVGALDGSAKGGGMLAVMFFALAFGLAMTTVPDRVQPLVAVLEGVYDTVLAIIGFTMRLAPLAVAGLIFHVTALLGLDVLKILVTYVAAVLGGLSLHLVVVYSLVVLLFAGISPMRFFSRVGEAMLTAFATSSSNATLPTTLRVAAERLGVRPQVGNFVLTVGATGNQNGTALYEGVTVLFLAQVFLPDPLTLAQQMQVAVLAILAGVGTAGVPGGSLPLVVMVLQVVGVPAESIAVIFGVDRVLDMCRTTVNVTGDLVIAASVDHSEGAGGAAGE